MSYKPQTDADIDLLEYSFDQYQRYQDIRLAIDAIQSHQAGHPLTILDVGGSPLTKKFLPQYSVVSANLELGHGVHVQCDGSRLPFESDWFDVVITVDTLEHVPPALRTAFIQELLRVSKANLLITGPFANGYNEEAEEELNNFLLNALGIQHRFLIEHLQNGLPDVDECVRTVTEGGSGCVTIPSGYIHHWLPFMIIKHDLMHISVGQEIVRDLDRFYNYACYWSDHRLPSYRQVVAASKKYDVDVLNSVQRAFDLPEETPRPDFNGVVAMWQALRWRPMLEEHAREINQLRVENRRLNDLVTGYASGRVMRFMAAVKCWLYPSHK